MCDEELRGIIRREIDAEFSDLENRPSLYPTIMRRISGERVAKRRVSLALVLAVVMVLALGSLAVAAGLGLFGQMQAGKRDETSYNRLEKLEEAAVQIGETKRLTVGGAKRENPQTTRDELLNAQMGRTYDLTLDQAYCDGRKLYYAYTLKLNDERLMLGEGEATGFDSWDMEYPGERFEDGFDLGLGEAPNETAAKWLSGHPCGYVVKRNAYLGDGAKLPDGTYLSPVDSGVAETDGQTVRAYYEVELPEGYQPGGTVDFVLTVIISDTIYVQNESGLYEATLMDGAAMLDVPFSVPATGNIWMLKGEGTADGYAAHAALALSDVDISGEVRIDAPTDYAPQGYALLADGVTYPNLNEWMEYDGQTHVIHLRFDVPQTTDGLALVPIDPAYADEAIELN